MCASLSTPLSPVPGTFVLLRSQWTSPSSLLPSSRGSVPSVSFAPLSPLLYYAAFFQFLHCHKTTLSLLLFCFSKTKENFRAGELGQLLQILAALAEDPSSIPGIHMVAHNHPQLQLQGIRHPFLTSAGIRRTRGT